LVLAVVALDGYGARPVRSAGAVVWIGDAIRARR